MQDYLQIASVFAIYGVASCEVRVGGKSGAAALSLPENIRVSDE